MSLHEAVLQYCRVAALRPRLFLDGHEGPRNRRQGPRERAAAAEEPGDGARRNQAEIARALVALS